MKIIAELVAGVVLLVVWIGSYLVMRPFATGPIVELAAVLAGMIAGFAVRSAIRSRIS